MHVHFTVELDMACKWAPWFRLDGKLALNSFDTVDDFYVIVDVNVFGRHETNSHGGIEGQCLLVSVCKQSCSSLFLKICFKPHCVKKKPAGLNLSLIFKVKS